MDQTKRDDRAERALMMLGQGETLTPAPSPIKGEGDEVPVYCEARPVLPEEKFGWIGEHIVEGFSAFFEDLQRKKHNANGLR